MAEPQDSPSTPQQSEPEKRLQQGCIVAFSVVFFILAGCGLAGWWMGCDSEERRFQQEKDKALERLIREDLERQKNQRNQK